MTQDMKPIVVLGAGGNVGRPLVRRLKQIGAAVRPLSRADDPIEAMTGARAVFVNPRAIGTRIDLLIAAALRADVERLVVLSALNVDDPDELQPSRVPGDLNREVERAVVASCIEHVVLRSDVMCPNVVGTMAPQLRVGDVVRSPYAAAREALVHEDDVAEVAAEALTTQRWSGQTLELRGPQAMTMAERVAVLARVIGRPLSHQQVTPEQGFRALALAGLPDAFVERYLAMQLHGLTVPVVASRLSELLGHPARSFEGWAREHAEVFG